MKGRGLILGGIGLVGLLIGFNAARDRNAEAANHIYASAAPSEDFGAQGDARQEAQAGGADGREIQAPHPLAEVVAERALVSPEPYGENIHPAPLASYDGPTGSIKREATFVVSPLRLAYAPPDPWRSGGETARAPLPSRRPADLGARPADPAAPAPEGAPPKEGEKPNAEAEKSNLDKSAIAKGGAIYVRLFKREGILELWAKRDGRYALQKTYPICKWSGKLGPKERYADYQSPEGFYAVSAKQLKPNSAYFRAINVGYPNALDKQHGRTGDMIMVHGACKSVGCFAMTDKSIGEIYSVVEAAIRGGQKEVPVHIFPFKLTEAAIARETPSGFASLFVGGGSGSGRTWGDFWKNLKEGYDLFERTGEPPTAYACNGRYKFGAAGASGGCTRIAGW